MLISVMSGNHDIPTFKNNCVLSMALTWAALTRFLYCVLTVVDKSSYFGPLKKKKRSQFVSSTYSPPCSTQPRSPPGQLSRSVQALST